MCERTLHEDGSTPAAYFFRVTPPRSGLVQATISDSKSYSGECLECSLFVLPATGCSRADTQIEVAGSFASWYL